MLSVERVGKLAVLGEELGHIIAKSIYCPKDVGLEYNKCTHLVAEIGHEEYEKLDERLVCEECWENALKGDEEDGL